MHYRFLVTCDKAYAETSKRARTYVSDFLIEEGFDSDGRFSSSYADWFVIGGRWSGELSRHSWGKDLYARIDAIEREHDTQIWGTYYGDPAMQSRQAKLAREIQKMWKREAPAPYKRIPYQRDTYKEDGYADDAMLLTEELYEALLKEYEGTDESEHHADLEWEPISPAMVGRKWLVVVDYHL